MTRPADADHDESSPLADPALRLAARAIDAFVPGAPFFLVLPLGIGLRSSLVIHAGLWASVATALALLGLNLFWLHRYGQTLGKRLLGLRIVLAEGDRATLGRILVRRIIVPGVIELIPLFGWFFALADALFVFSDTRQTLHDRIAGTIVVDLKRGGPPDEPGPTRF